MRHALLVCLLGLLSLVGAVRAQPYSPATHRLGLTDLAGGNPQAIHNVDQAAGKALLWSAGVLTPLGTLDGSQSLGVFELSLALTKELRPGVGLPGVAKIFPP